MSRRYGGLDFPGLHKHGEEEASGKEGRSVAQSRSQDLKRLKVALGLTGSYFLVELAGGWLMNSLALMSDAGHMFSDLGAMGLSLFAAYVAALPATSQKTFGYYRAEILAAFVNGLTLWLAAGVIFHEAYQRFFHPPKVQGEGLLLIASVGLGVNLLTAWILRTSHTHSLNLRGVLLHVVSDALGSVGAIVAGGVILLTEWYWADPLVSVGIGLLILASSFGLVRDSVDILMQATPRHIHLEEVQRVMEGVEGVRQIHDLHVWTLTSGVFTLSAHAVVDPERDPHTLLDRLEECLKSRFGIEHITIQLEFQSREESEPARF